MINYTRHTFDPTIIKDIKFKFIKKDALNE